MIYHEIITELSSLNKTPQTIIAQYERIEFGQSYTNDEKLLNCYFTKNLLQIEPKSYTTSLFKTHRD